MGHFCWMCERSRPNEAFSGSGHRRHLCRECSRLPRPARERKERLDSLWGMLFGQRVISVKNVRMAMDWTGSEDPEVSEVARIVADIGRLHPGRKRRLPFLRDRHPDLWTRMLAAGLVPDFGDDDPEDGSARDDAAYSQLAEDQEELVENEDEIPF